ncbi:MAG: alpha/beta fold hydrolase, partial [Bacteroidota bacterium]
MKKEKLHIGESAYTYYRYGYGNGLLIALHGYGESGLAFKGLESIWADRYTIIAPDLPFHGDTQLAKADFDASDMDALLQGISERFGGRPLALMGHSFGGRVLLYLLPKWAKRVDQYFLLSPDGLATPGMRWSLRLPIALQKGIQRLLSGWSLQPLFKTLHRLGWLSFHQQYFLSYHLGDRERQARLFAYWRSLRHFTLRKREL